MKITHVLLTVNLLITLPLTLVFLLKIEPPSFLTSDPSSSNILNEFGWNRFIAELISYTVLTLSLSWFGLTHAPRSWRFLAVTVAAVSVLYVNSFLENQFVAEALPLRVHISHVVQALAFCSVLLPPSRDVVSKRPMWAHLVWWALFLVNGALLLTKLYMTYEFSVGFFETNSYGELKEKKVTALLTFVFDIKNHGIATLTYAWNNVALFFATLGLSWYAPRKYKLIPFGILAVCSVTVNHMLETIMMQHWGWIVRRDQRMHYEMRLAVAFVYLLQILIPAPEQRGAKGKKSK